MRHILVVEDDTSIRDMLTDVLEDEGYRVIRAASGCEALVQLRERRPPPHLILLDLMLPHMNGWDFCEEWRRDPQLADIPVVIVSASSHIRERQLPCDIAACLAKPFELDTLLEIVERYSR
jgi:CheY-like chemotaxis protein